MVPIAGRMAGQCKLGLVVFTVAVNGPTQWNLNLKMTNVGVRLRRWKQTEIEGFFVELLR